MTEAEQQACIDEAIDRRMKMRYAPRGSIGRIDKNANVN